MPTFVSKSQDDDNMHAGRVNVTLSFVHTGRVIMTLRSVPVRACHRPATCWHVSNTVAVGRAHVANKKLRNFAPTT
jgi:hypothetical protein